MHDTVNESRKSYLTTSQLAERLEIGALTLAQWRKRRQGPPSYRLGGVVRYDRQALADWLKEQGHPHWREIAA